MINLFHEWMLILKENPDKLLVFVVIAVIRVGFIFYARRDTGAGPKKPETTYSSNMDDYVPHTRFSLQRGVRQKKNWWAS